MPLVRFWKDCRGAVAPMFAIVIVPLIGVAGAAVDYTRASAARAAMQSSLDSTALMLSKTAATQSSVELQAMATSTFNALFTAQTVQNVAVTTNYSSTGGSTVTLTASGTVPVDFLNILGFNAINISASTKATWGNTRLRVALVLDNTGSMAQSGKMTALQSASQNFLTQIKTAATNPEDAYVSIVPFNKDVNVNASNVSESWLRWDLYGHRPVTAPGTAVSPTETRISIPPTMRRSPAALYTRLSNILPAPSRSWA
jgi:Flp pilus assembly protein TadG